MKPAPIASTIQPWCTITGWNQVARTATSIPVTPAATAWRAVLGSFIQYSEKMNSAVARMAATWATAFVMEANRAIAPRTRIILGYSAPVTAIDPTTAIAEIAFVSDMRGV